MRNIFFIFYASTFTNTILQDPIALRIDYHYLMIAALIVTGDISHYIRSTVRVPRDLGRYQSMSILAVIITYANFEISDLSILVAVATSRYYKAASASFETHPTVWAFAIEGDYRRTRKFWQKDICNEATTEVCAPQYYTCRYRGYDADGSFLFDAAPIHLDPQNFHHPVAFFTVR